MRIRVVAVGSPRHGAMADVIAGFEARARRYWPIEVVEVRPESARSVAPAIVRRREGERLLAQAVGTLVACDERGRGMTSDAFAAWLGAERDRAADVTFLLGGAYGLDETVRARAARILSLAPWTVSHDLARLLLAEQLYRAGTIRRGEPYHK